MSWDLAARRWTSARRPDTAFRSVATSIVRRGHAAGRMRSSTGTRFPRVAGQWASRPEMLVRDQSGARARSDQGSDSDRCALPHYACFGRRAAPTTAARFSDSSGARARPRTALAG
jgi:hypothetical protein